MENSYSVHDHAIKTNFLCSYNKSANRLAWFSISSKLALAMYQEPMSAAKPREGAYNFNEKWIFALYGMCVYKLHSCGFRASSEARLISCSRFPYMAW